ncbi:hypothetical protein ACVIW2_009409 [Bradyrhizobium huanghuaihaiense]
MSEKEAPEKSSASLFGSERGHQHAATGSTKGQWLDGRLERAVRGAEIDWSRTHHIDTPQAQSLLGNESAGISSSGVGQMYFYNPFTTTGTDRLTNHEQE